MANRKFITEEAFAVNAAILKKEDEILKWADLKVGVTYIINYIQVEISAKYGECYILHIEDTEENKLKAWGTTTLVDKIKEKRQETDLVYFKSLGQRFENRKTYNEFDLVIDDDGDIAYDIFNKTVI